MSVSTANWVRHRAGFIVADIFSRHDTKQYSYYTWAQKLTKASLICHTKQKFKSEAIKKEETERS